MIKLLDLNKKWRVSILNMKDDTPYVFAEVKGHGVTLPVRFREVRENFSETVLANFATKADEYLRDSSLDNLRAIGDPRWHAVSRFQNLCESEIANRHENKFWEGTGHPI